MNTTVAAPSVSCLGLPSFTQTGAGRTGSTPSDLDLEAAYVGLQTPRESDLGTYGAIPITPQSTIRPARDIERISTLRAQRIACGTLFSTFGFVFGHFLSQMPNTKERLEVSDPRFGSLLLADDLGNLAALLAARLTPKMLYGRIAAPMMGATAATASGIAIVSRSQTQFGVSMFGFGAAASLFDVAANLQMVGLEAASGQSETSLFHGLFSAGQLIGSSIGAAFSRGHLPFDTRIQGVTACVAAVYLGHLPFVHRISIHEETLPQGERQNSWAMAGLLAVSFLSSLAEGAASEWPGIYLRQDLGADLSTANLAALAYAGGMTTSRLVGAPAANRWGIRPVLVAGGVLTTCGMTAALLKNSSWAILLGIGVVGAGLANNTPLTISAAGRLSSDFGANVAALTLAQQLGFFTGPPLLGALSGITGLRAAIGVIPMVGASLAVCTFLVT